MYYAKVGCADTFENRQLQSSARLTSAPLFFFPSPRIRRRRCGGERRGGGREKQICVLQVESDGPASAAAGEQGWICGLPLE